MIKSCCKPVILLSCWNTCGLQLMPQLSCYPIVVSTVNTLSTSSTIHNVSNETMIQNAKHTHTCLLQQLQVSAAVTIVLL